MLERVGWLVIVVRCQI